MPDTREFLRKVLDTLDTHVVVIDKTGKIFFVNRTWVEFGQDNACAVRLNWDNLNYLVECERAAQQGDEFGRLAGEGILNVITGRLPRFYLEYPCHAPDQRRWFKMRVIPFFHNNNTWYTITHENITERKLSEEKALDMARMDGLTGIFNRRHFDETIENELKRSVRQQLNLTLVLIDVDHFKLYNDTYGHLAGDECLKEVASILKETAQRPSDLVARYGGEEFVILLGDTVQCQAEQLMKRLSDSLSRAAIEHERSPVNAYVTLSAGVITAAPDSEMTAGNLLAQADNLLYKAKEQGRNLTLYRTIS